MKLIIHLIITALFFLYLPYWYSSDSRPIEEQYAVKTTPAKKIVKKRAAIPAPKKLPIQAHKEIVSSPTPQPKKQTTQSSPTHSSSHSGLSVVAGIK